MRANPIASTEIDNLESTPPPRTPLSSDDNDEIMPDSFGIDFVTIVQDWHSKTDKEAWRLTQYRRYIMRIDDVRQCTLEQCANRIEAVFRARLEICGCLYYLPSLCFYFPRYCIVGLLPTCRKDAAAKRITAHLKPTSYRRVRQRTTRKRRRRSTAVMCREAQLPS